MKMFFIFVGLMFYLWIFLENFWLPIIMLFFFAWGIAFAVFFIRKKGIPEKVIGVSTGLLIGLAFPVFLLVTVLQDDFVKSRKNVETEWMMGKTLEQIAERYSCPVEYKEEKLKGPDYYFACREIYDWDDFDDVVDEYYYFVALDSSGRVTDIYVYDNDNDFTGAVNNHSYDEYQDRWGNIYTYKILLFSSDFNGPVNDKNKVGLSKWKDRQE